MSPKKPAVLTIFLACVWLVNGLMCKVMNLVPRHEQIIGEFFGDSHARLWAVLIGLAEAGMAAWILSGIQRRWCTWTQVALVVTMNVLEVTYVPDRLLWGRFNAVFALLFILLLLYHEFRPGAQAPHQDVRVS